MFFSVKYLINMMVLNRGSMILISRGLCNGSYFKLVLFFFQANRLIRDPP